MYSYDRRAHYSYDRRATDRPKYQDGRLIPQEGDKVYQIVGGAFGMSAVIEGVVFKSRGALRVKVTGGGGVLGVGSAPVGKTYALNPVWTVINDPAIKAREEAREREKLEKATREQSIKEEAVRAIEAEAHRLGLRRITGIHDVKVGDEVYLIHSEGELGRGDPHKVSVNQHTVTGVENKWFLFIADHGGEVTSGKPELWWKKH